MKSIKKKKIFDEKRAITSRLSNQIYFKIAG
jgi:hypothetical protein